jgi:hypothetical protein
MLRAALSVHCERSGDDFQQLEWYKIRDMFFGRNCCVRQHVKALELAAVCKHLDAVWLTKSFAGLDVCTAEEARQVLLDCENDPRALCFAAFLHWGKIDEMHRAADLGNAFAQAEMAGKSNGEERFRWAEKSAAQGERDGFYWLGRSFRNGDGCREDMERAKENYLIAAELGCVDAMYLYALRLAKTEPLRYLWLGKAADHGIPSVFLQEMKDQITINSSSSNVVFAIGRALKGQINIEKQEIFGSNRDFELFITNATHALEFFNFQLQFYRRAVNCWTLVGIRNKVVKDVRKKIAKKIWDSREEAKY